MKNVTKMCQLASAQTVNDSSGITATTMMKNLEKSLSFCCPNIDN